MRGFISILCCDSLHPRLLISAPTRWREPHPDTARACLASVLLQFWKSEILEYLALPGILTEAGPREEAGIVCRLTPGSLFSPFLNDERDNANGFPTVVYEKRVVLGPRCFSRTEIKLVRNPSMPKPPITRRVDYPLPEFGGLAYVSYINRLCMHGVSSQGA